MIHCFHLFWSTFSSLTGLVDKYSEKPKKLFVPMTVGEVKISFGSNIDKMPYNTFRIEVNQKGNDTVNISNKRQKLPRKSFGRKQQEQALHVDGVKVTQG